MYAEHSIFFSPTAPECFFFFLARLFRFYNHYFLFLAQKQQTLYMLVAIVGNVSALCYIWRHLSEFSCDTQGHDCKTQTLNGSAFRRCQSKWKPYT